MDRHLCHVSYLFLYLCCHCLSSGCSLSSAGLILLHPDLLPSSFLKLKYERTSLLTTCWWISTAYNIQYKPLSLVYKALQNRLSFPYPQATSPCSTHLLYDKNLFSVMHFAVLHLRLLMTFYKIGQIPDECQVLQGYKNYPRPFCISFIQ